MTKILVSKVKEMKNILINLENTLNKEYENLLHNNINKDFFILIDIKKNAIKTFYSLNKERIHLEKKYNVSRPYYNHDVLNNDWNFILKKCILLKKINLKNKILINKKFYFNENFLELFPHYEPCINDFNMIIK